MTPFFSWLNQSKCNFSLGAITPILLGCLLQGTGMAIAQTVSSRPALVNQAQMRYNIAADVILSGTSNTIQVRSSGLTDPAGQILGCGGQPLADYTGFKVGLFNTQPNDPTRSELGSLLPLTPTELPDNPTNTIPKGILPNTTNLNPYALNNADVGRFSFLLDRSKGQLEVGKTYILVVMPPATSTLYSQRRIKIEILSIQTINDEDIVTYRATSLDGLPISITGSNQFDQTSVIIVDANRGGLQLLALSLNNALCQQNQVQLTKSGDRASAAPGDIVIYRLSVRNTSDGPLHKTVISDVLPLGFKFLPQSVRAELAQQPVPLKVTQEGQSVTLTPDVTLPVNATLNIAYAAQLTPDALRGTGTNSATALSHRTDNQVVVKDGPALHRVRLSAGLLTNCGTILGRVFEDRNFDGEQQDGETGIPNAVVYLEDGNRITTDKDGLFSVKCALPGYHTGVLDPMSVPGYRMAPNRRFIEGNSKSRLVRLAPGSMVRMNFAVTPTATPEAKP